MENESWVAELSANWNEILPLILHYEPNDTISEKLREFYFGSLDQPLTNESFGQLSKVSTVHQNWHSSILLNESSSISNVKIPVHALLMFRYF